MAGTDYKFLKPEGLLAHYTTAEIAFAHIVPTGRLRMSPYRLMRDPAENKTILPTLGGWGDHARWEQAVAIAYRTIHDVRDAMRVLSFTRDATPDHDDDESVSDHYRLSTFDCCWARPRMWEQYGERHRGACLLFDPHRLEHALDAHLPRTILSADVRYTREGVFGSAFRHISDGKALDPETAEQAARLHLFENYDDYYFLKSDDFAGEREHRMICRVDRASAVDGSGTTVDEEGFVFVPYDASLVAVVVGHEFPEWQRAGAAGVCAKAHVPFRRLHWENGRPILLGG